MLQKFWENERQFFHLENFEIMVKLVMDNHPFGQGLVVWNRVVVTDERFQYISIANMAATILFTFFFDSCHVCTGS